MAAFGYARVSTRDQTSALQVEALRRAGVDEIHEETASGARERPVLEALLARLQHGDSLTTWKLDRIGRSARQTLDILEGLRVRGATYRSITEGLDTATPFGRLGITILAAIAEMEREVLLERIHAGIAISRAEGRHGRRPAYDIARVRHAQELIGAGGSLREVSRKVGIARSTLADALARLPTSSP
jgi:DNA invertase Pin-like site-specific DNA recombinase